MLEQNPYREDELSFKEPRLSVVAINMESSILRIYLLGEDLGAYLKDLDAIFTIFTTLILVKNLGIIGGEYWKF